MQFDIVTKTEMPKLSHLNSVTANCHKKLFPI